MPSTHHRTTSNDVRLFCHIATHYDKSIYQDFIQLHRRKPDHEIWVLYDHFTAIQHALEDLCGLASEAQSVDDRLEAEAEFTACPARATDPADIPTIIEEPIVSPRHPAGSVQENMSLHRVHTAPPTERPTFSTSFGAVEDQIHHRGHYRSATIATDTSYTTPEGHQRSIAQPYPRHPWQAATGVRRQSSISDVPRIFTGSFSELEEKISKVLRQQSAQNPERIDSPDSADPVKVRDFATEPGTPYFDSMCPSPVTLLQRREALVSRDVQWEDRVVNGELVRSRRPSDRQRAHTIDDRSGGIEGWLAQSPKSELAGSGSPGSAVRRGMLRQRENTL